LIKSNAILVTGGAGYVGSHFVARLEDDGAGYVVLDDLSRGCARFVPAQNLVCGDIADEALVERSCRERGVDTVVHFAAYAYVGESVAEPQKILCKQRRKDDRLAACDSSRGRRQFRLLVVVRHLR
jgi:UDP-glucose 4-epimerase